AVGSIHYEDVEPNTPPGVLVYIKSSLTGDEPSDVQNYAALHPEFPHQSTGDQFFDESQFESYRALGYHIALDVFSEAVARLDAAPQPPDDLTYLTHNLGEDAEQIASYADQLAAADPQESDDLKGLAKCLREATELRDFLSPRTIACRARILAKA